MLFTKAGCDEGRPGPWELVLLFGILALGAWLRLRELDLVEYKRDEAAAVDLSRRLLDGDLLGAGLPSSVGVHNPPLFIYLLAVPLSLRDDPLFATAFVGTLAVIAIALTHFALRRRFGQLAALAAATLFATAPWAVLFGRKIWAQDVLPVFTVLLLTSLFLVLERSRSRAVLLVPVLVCLSFQLNFSAVALLIPSAILLLYRAREVHWPAFAVGVGVAVLLIGPWLAFEAKHFGDARLLFSAEREGGGTSLPGAGAAMAVRQTARITGATGWGDLSGSSFDLVRSEMGSNWTLGNIAGLGSWLLLFAGVGSIAIQLARRARITRTWPFVDMPTRIGRRTLLLVWLVGIWLTYSTSTTGQVHSHYLIVTYPVSFVVQGLLLADLASLARGQARRIATGGAYVVVAFLTVGFVAFTLGFHGYLEQHGGTAGDYGVVYRDKAALARVVREHGLRVADDRTLDLLVTGGMDTPPGAALVTVRDRFENDTQLTCEGDLRSFGVLEVCLPLAPR